MRFIPIIFIYHSYPILLKHFHFVFFSFGLELAEVRLFSIFLKINYILNRVRI